ncbi:MAG: hypothetical protein JHC98_01350 [Thermoleophilaceae bacterium]|nr:hypothetical protein [Thermoleophilaceae bacterium]
MTGRLQNPAMIVAILALVLALGGSAIAAGLKKNSVTNRSIKKNAVTGIKVKNSSLTGADVKNSSLTGADIDESTLKQVPSAGNADAVGGIPAAKLTTDDTLIKFNVVMNRGPGVRTLATAGPFTLTGSCFENGATNFDVRAEAATSVNDTYGTVGTSPLDTDFDVGETKYINNAFAVAPNARSRLAGGVDLLDPTSGLAVQGTVYEFYGFPGANCRYVGVLTVERP